MRGTDLAPILKGLSNDLWPCPHRGYMLKGRIRVRYADGEEVLRAGGIFHPPPEPPPGPERYRLWLVQEGSS
jgi:hypothetical protein